MAFTSQLDHWDKSLCDICQALRKHRYRHEDILLLNNNVLLDEHVRDVADKLTDDALLKLAFMTWHLDASKQEASSGTSFRDKSPPD